MTRFLSFCALLLLGTACAPTVKLEAPDKPIQINMNIKIEQEVRVRVEKDIESEIASNPQLFGVPAKKTTHK